MQQHNHANRPRNPIQPHIFAPPSKILWEANFDPSLPPIYTTRSRTIARSSTARRTRYTGANSCARMPERARIHRGLCSIDCERAYSLPVIFGDSGAPKATKVLKTFRIVREYPLFLPSGSVWMSTSPTPTNKLRKRAKQQQKRAMSRRMFAKNQCCCVMWQSQRLKIALA